MALELTFWRLLISDRIEPFEAMYLSKCDDVAVLIEAVTGKIPTYKQWLDVCRYVQASSDRLTRFICGDDADLETLIREALIVWVFEDTTETVAPVLAQIAPTRPLAAPTTRCVYRLLSCPAGGSYDLSGLPGAARTVVGHLTEHPDDTIQAIMDGTSLARSTVMNVMTSLRQRLIVKSVSIDAVAA